MNKLMMTLPILLILLLMGCGETSSNPVDPKPEPDPDPTITSIDWNAAANTSTQALIGHFWNNNSNYWNVSTGKKQFAYWTGAHATDVLVAAYVRTDNSKYLRYIDNWYLGVQQQMNGTFINNYFDDMEWNALALLRAYDINEEEKFKQSADNLWTNIKRGWSDDIAGGGIIWTRNDPNGKNAISNAPASILASKMYKLTGDEDDLEWAKKIYAWEKNTLVDPETGAVWDNIKVHADGSSDIQKDWVFTYNQGVHLGAALKLYEITDKQEYLDDAVKAANYTLNHLTNKTDNLLKDEGDGDGGLFKGIFVRYFTELILEEDLDESTREKYIDFIKHNAKMLWNEGRNKNNLYSSYWKTKPGLYSLVDQSTETSGSILIECMALLKRKGLIED